MDYNRIILELLDRIQTLEERVAALENDRRDNDAAQRATQQTAIDLRNVSNKYKPLAIYLLNSNANSVTLNYAQIEEILQRKLPATAYNFIGSFWANTTTHSYSSSWLNVGYKTKVNSSDNTITFEKFLF